MSIVFENTRTNAADAACIFIRHFQGISARFEIVRLTATLRYMRMFDGDPVAMFGYDGRYFRVCAAARLHTQPAAWRGALARQPATPVRALCVRRGLVAAGAAWLSVTARSEGTTRRRVLSSTAACPRGLACSCKEPQPVACFGSMRWRRRCSRNVRAAA